MKRIVIKIGTSLLTKKDGSFDNDYILELSRVISKIKKQNEIIIITSGAIAAGIGKFFHKSKPKSLREKQISAAIGQPLLMQIYENLFSKYNLQIAQILLTREDLEKRNRYLNIRDTIFGLLNFGVIPIINENDTVSSEEIQFGDNDILAAMVAIKVNADILIILTNVDGLYTSDPNLSEDVKLIQEIKEITPEVEKMAKRTTTTSGTGGMESKILAAKICMQSGTEMFIANGKPPSSIEKIIDGEKIGTRFIPLTSGMDAKKKWIGFISKAKGRIVIDEGAVDAIKNKGKSLLPSGILSVAGNFDTGDTVDIVDQQGRKIARGLTYYGSEDIKRIKGKKTNEISKILKEIRHEEIIHRNNLVISKK